MVCSSCGKMNADGVSFCEYCGTNLRPATAVAPAAAFTEPVAPTAADVAKLSKSLLNSLSLGDKFTGVGALAAMLGFFLPWVSTPDLGALTPLLGELGASGLAHVSLNGVDLAKFIGAVYFYLLAPVAAGILCYYSMRSPAPRRLLMAGFLVLIGSICGPGVMLSLIFVPMIQSVAGAGFWLIGLGYCAIATGGLITIGEVGKTAR